MKVIIAGSRKMQDYSLVPLAVEASGFDITEEVCGEAAGADTFGALWAYKNDIPIKRFPADWKRYGNAAGPIRNGEMKEYADAAIIFIWEGSRGSQDMLRKMQDAGKPVYVVYNGVIE